MDDQDRLAERFEQHRPRLRAVSYRMLGSLSEADDAVQEAWLRLSNADTRGVDDLGAWLTTVVARICLNVLRSRRTRRGSHSKLVPDPVVSAPDAVDPADEALIADSVGLALLVVLTSSLRPSGSRSSCTTCSTCHLSGSRRSSIVRNRRRGSSQAALAGVCGAPCSRNGSRRAVGAGGCVSRRRPRR